MPGGSRRGSGITPDQDEPISLGKFLAKVGFSRGRPFSRSGSHSDSTVSVADYPIPANLRTARGAGGYGAGAGDGVEKGGGSHFRFECHWAELAPGRGASHPAAIP